jgi:hypothetical protein
MPWPYTVSSVKWLQFYNGKKSVGKDRITNKSIITPMQGYRKKDGLTIEDRVDLKSLSE